jgi:hypothetical protein
MLTVRYEDCLRFSVMSAGAVGMQVFARLGIMTVVYDQSTLDATQWYSAGNFQTKSSYHYERTVVMITMYSGTTHTNPLMIEMLTS